MKRFFIRHSALAYIISVKIFDDGCINCSHSPKNPYNNITMNDVEVMIPEYPMFFIYIQHRLHIVLIDIEGINTSITDYDTALVIKVIIFVKTNLPK